MDVQVDGDIMQIRRSTAVQNKNISAAIASVCMAGALLAAGPITAGRIIHSLPHGAVWIATVAVVLLVTVIAAWVLFGAMSAFRIGLATGRLPLVLDRAAGEYRRGDTRLGELSEIASISVEPATPRARNIIRVYAHTSTGVLHAIPDEHAHYRPEDHAGELGGLIAEFLRIPFTECRGCSGSLK